MSLDYIVRSVTGRLSLGEPLEVGANKSTQ